MAWIRANKSSGGGTSDRMYTASFNYDNYVCVITESSSADIVAVFKYNNTGNTPYEDDYIKAWTSGVNSMNLQVKKACTMTKYTQMTQNDTALNANDYAINAAFTARYQCFLKFTN